MELQFRTGQQTDQLVVVPSGDLDLYSSVSFCNTVSEKMDQGTPKVVLDFAQVRYLDSSGVGAIIRLLQKAKKLTGEIKAASLGGTPRKVLEMSNIISLLKVYPDTETALKAWG